MHLIRLAPFGLFLGLLAHFGCGGGGGGGPVPGSSSGSLLPTFGAAGLAEANPSPDADVVEAMVTGATHMYVGGSDRAVGPTDAQWRVEKRSLADGSLDPAFGVGGVVQVNPGGGNDAVLALAIDPTAIYVCGWDSTPGDLQWRIEKRSRVDGSLVAGFGAGGVVTVNPTGGADSPTALLIVGDRLYVAGNDGNNILVEKRSTVDGTLDPGFGIGGVVQSNPSPAYDTASSLATDGTSLFLAGRDQSLGGGDWSLRVEKRNLSDGALVAGFGAGGVVTSSPSPTYDAAYAIAYAAGWIYLAGTDEGPGAGDRRFRIEKRSAADGAPDAAFGAGGAVTADFGAGDDELLGIVVDGGFLYVGGLDEAPGHGRWHVQKRQTSNGTLVGTFGIGGIVIDDPSPFWEYVAALAVDGTALYVAGTAGGTAVTDTYWRIEKRLK